jgi:hypothetical protein
MKMRLPLLVGAGVTFAVAVMGLGAAAQRSRAVVSVPQQQASIETTQLAQGQSAQGQSAPGSSLAPTMNIR